MNQVNHSFNDKLRKKAEELLKSRSEDYLNESDMVKLVHELRVHQIELELQNEELISANNITQTAVKNYTDLFDFTPACYYTLTRSGDILSLNNSGAQLLGKEAGNLINSKFGFFISNGTKPAFNALLDNLFVTRIKQSCEATIVNNNNTQISVYIVGQITRDGSAANLNVIDIDDRIKAEEELRKLLSELRDANNEILQQKIEIENQAKELNITNKELEQMVNLNSDKNRFISILAHDLKSPFTVLLGFSEMLLEKIHQFDLDEIEKMLKVMNQSAMDTFALLENMLKWASMQSGKMPFEPNEINLAELGEEVTKVLNPYAMSKSITLINLLPAQLIAFADKNMINAVLRNLISNAIKFTSHNGLIKISAKQSDSNLTISVSDNGTGMTPERLSRLFEISELHSSAGTSNEKGSGFGLLICKEFVEKHGGKIWAESEPDKGSVFYFTIPFKVEPEVINTEPDYLVDNQVKNLKILIVDDQYSLRLILSEMTKKFSREFLYATSGEEAIEMCHINPDIDLILMDYQLPELNGIETAKRIRSVNKKVRIIIQTAYDIKDTIDEMDSSSDLGFFTKPYSKLILAQLIQKYFEKIA